MLRKLCPCCIDDKSSVSTKTPEPTPLPVVGQPIDADYKEYKALFSYNAKESGDLSFKKHDILLVRTSELKNDWWQAHLKSNRKSKGFVPKNYLVENTKSIRSHEAYYNINRIEMERKLILTGNPVYTFALRPSSNEGNFALSVKDTESIKHFKIYALDEDRGYYIKPSKTFATIEDLIDNYRKSQSLGVYLKFPLQRDYVPPSNFRDFFIDRSKINLEKNLGHGHFGEVQLAKWNNVLQVAVKTSLSRQVKANDLLHEAEIMHKLYHPKIVQLLGVCLQTETEPMYIIMEYMPKGNLSELLKSDAGKLIDYNDAIYISNQISDGMMYIEANTQIVHSDLRAANILVGDNYSVKIADFGLSTIINGDKKAKAMPVPWTAPEVLSGEEPTTKSDVWSFGVLLYEIFSHGTPLYQDKRKFIDSMLEFLNNGNRLPMPKPLGDDFIYDVMNSCWRAEAETRPTFNFLYGLLENDKARENQYQA